MAVVASMLPALSAGAATGVPVATSDQYQPPLGEVWAATRTE